MTKYTLVVTGLVREELRGKAMLPMSGEHRDFIVNVVNEKLSKIYRTMQEQLKKTDTQALQINSFLSDIAENTFSSDFFFTHAVWVIEQLATQYPNVIFVFLYKSAWIDIKGLNSCFPSDMNLTPFCIASYWAEYYREVLRLKIRLGKQIVLLNADYIGDAGDALKCFFHSNFDLDPESLLPSANKLINASADTDMDLLLQAIYQKLVPDTYEIYVNLESCAELLGRSPHFAELDDAEWSPLVFNALIRKINYETDPAQRHESADYLNSLETKIRVQLERITELESLLQLTTEYLHESQQEIETQLNEKDTLVTLVNRMQTSLERAKTIFLKKHLVTPPN